MLRLTSPQRQGTKLSAITHCTSQQTVYPGLWTSHPHCQVCPLSTSERLSEHMGRSWKHNRKGFRRPLERVLWRSTASIAAVWGYTANLLVMLPSYLFWQQKNRKVIAFFPTKLSPYLWIWQNSYKEEDTQTAFERATTVLTLFWT